MEAAIQAQPLIATLDAIFRQQHRLSREQIPDYASRVTALKALKQTLIDHQDELADAMSRDFGNRAISESKMTDVMPPVLDINHTLRHLKRWMKPVRRSTELLFASNKARLHYQPKGVVGIIVPWNFPVYLAVGPLTAALAAGNRAMIKMSEYVPETTAVFARIIGEIFPSEQVYVTGGDVDVAQHFSSLPFDHLLFTGSTSVGRHVMQAAARNLTPVTLELGGKSPAVVSSQGDIKAAAAKITHGKMVNAGQICVAPDYALLPRGMTESFVAEAKARFNKLYPTVAGNPDMTTIVNEGQYSRLKAVLEDAKDKGAQVHSCADIDDNSRQFPLQIVTGVTDDMRLLQEELFGPILPIVEYETIDEAISYINDRDRPLALYYFGHDRQEQDDVLDRTVSGGVTVNDCCWHVLNHDLPFGGIGPSGMGHYHGKEGFLEFSHARGVLKEHRFFPINLFYPPYGTAIQKLTLKLFIGSGKGK